MPHTSISRFGLILAAALVLLAGLVTAAIYLTRPQVQPVPEELGKPVMAAQIEFLADAMQRRADCRAPADGGVFCQRRAGRVPGAGGQPASPEPGRDRAVRHRRPAPAAAGFPAG